MNKGELRAHFKALLNRSDCSDALSNTFVDQSITRIQRVLRIPAMEKQQTYSVASIGTPSIVFPSDMLEVLDIYFDATAMVRIPLHEMLQLKKTGETGVPRFFCRQQGTLLVFPVPTSGTIYLNYYGQFADMVEDTDENQLAQFASDLIIYGALGYASDWFLDERAGQFDQKYAQFMSEIQEQANDAELSGSVQVVRPTHTYSD